MKKILIILSIVFWGCTESTPFQQPKKTNASPSPNKIQVLNVGSFHFGFTSDATSVEFDENDAEKQQEIRELSKLLARFKPTIVCLEYIPEYHQEINTAYQAYIKQPEILNTNYGELSMVGFDVAHMNGLKQVFGIDNHMGYNYSLGDFIENSPELENSIDRETYLELTNEPFKHYPEIADLNDRFDELSLIEKLRLINDPVMLDYSLNTNADKLLYVGIDSGFQGAEQAAQFYLRNMKIYSNLNRIKMNKEDRVLILMGSAHTAMLREFIQRSPKFEMVNTLDYLKP
jgi:uncharacterized protein DUF5694